MADNQTIAELLERAQLSQYTEKAEETKAELSSLLNVVDDSKEFTTYCSDYLDSRKQRTLCAASGLGKPGHRMRLKKAIASAIAEGWGQNQGGKSSNPFNKDDGRTAKLSEIMDYKTMVGSSNPKEVLSGITLVRKLVSAEVNPPIQQVIDQGFVPILVNHLKTADKNAVLLECAWALTNIASSTHEHTNAVVKSGAVPLFIKNITHPQRAVQEQCIWALGNIAGDNVTSNKTKSREAKRT
eukprot:jgi/Bigna1/74878/fgenesh1_pg.31_\